MTSLSRHPQWLRAAGALAVLLLLAILPGRASASCEFSGRTGWTRVQFAPPSQIMVPNGAAVGTVLWTSPMVPADQTTAVYCDRTTYGGIVNYIGSAVTSGATTFPTNIPGVSYRLQRGSASSYLVASPADYLTSGTTTFSNNTALQFVVSGPVALGSTLSAGQLAHWDFGGGVGTVIVFQTSSSTTFVGPACTVATDPTVVTMAATVTGNLSGSGTTTGTTPFAIRLNCSTGSTLSITLNANNPISTANGVLRPTTGAGYASGVGVQIVNPNNNNSPVSFGQSIRVGATPNGPLAIPFAARYYRSTGTLKAGKVSATATYTLTYQ
ncbi:fimbrial protein [Frateuria sp. Soil773]|uniref:fimbrial protein n=1 Tax=Frateuria sp. Soil773 TaxID=1736407 RepID=UPI000AD05130|nr:fimbrial protein [Frateuria sp. Soil773]